jgi:1-acyl-sn-glycerol-3-phosphate acyltransferase
MWAMAKQQVMNWPVVGWILGKAGVFGVERGAADLKAAKTALRCLKENRKLLIFPEGTRVQEGESVDAKAGAALFATRSGAPLLPVYIEPRKKLFRPTTVVIGKPYYPEFSGRKASAEELQVIASDLMDRVRALGEVIK